MPQYAAIIYSKDVDWTLPEYATDMKEYNEFGQAAAAVIRGGAALYQTSTATTCLLYTSPSPRDGLLSRMPSSA